MAYGGKSGGFYNNRMIIDACRPYDRLRTFPALARVDSNEAAGLRARWGGLFAADGKVRRDVRQAGLHKNGVVADPMPVQH